MNNVIKSSYILSVSSKLSNYFTILCNDDYPYFIDDYIETATMQRLKGIGQLCACDYQKISSIIPQEWFTSLDHSIADALMAWHFTHSKATTIAALFHDSGSPAFRHCIDMMLNDGKEQGSSERDAYDFIINSPEILKLFERDGLTVGMVCNSKIYPVIENERPKLCTDRLDGVFHTGVFWVGFWNNTDIKIMYQDMCVLKNELNKPEIGFRTKTIAEEFHNNGVYKYSMTLQKNEDKMVMKFMSDILKLAVYFKVITLDDLYAYSTQLEADIISKIKTSNNSLLSECWDLFYSMEYIRRSNTKIKNKYCHAVDSKDRYTIPLCLYKGETKRLIDLKHISSSISPQSLSTYNLYHNFHDSPYAYLDNSENIQKQLSSIKGFHSNL